MTIKIECTLHLSSPGTGPAVMLHDESVTFDSLDDLSKKIHARMELAARLPLYGVKHITGRATIPGGLSLVIECPLCGLRQAPLPAEKPWPGIFKEGVIG